MLELGLRVIYGNPPSFVYPQASHVVTEYNYQKLKPNQTGTYTLNKPVRANSYGFRDFEWRVPKPAGIFRIMVVGDSMTFGVGVRGEDSFPKILERQLKRDFGNVEVLSASVQGWDTWHELEFFKREGFAYGADIVVIGLYMNDFRKGPLPPPEMTREGLIENRQPWLQWLPYKYIFLFKRSALIFYVRQRLETFGARGTNRGTMLLRNQIVAEKDEGITAAWSYIMEIARLAERNGGRVILAPIPSLSLFLLSRGSVGYLDYLRQQSRDNGIEFHDLAEAFWKHPNPERLYLYPWNMHLSVAGHELIADQLVDVLRKAIVKRERKAGSAQLMR